MLAHAEMSRSNAALVILSTISEHEATSCELIAKSDRRRQGMSANMLEVTTVDSALGMKYEGLLNNIEIPRQM